MPIQRPPHVPGSGRHFGRGVGDLFLKILVLVARMMAGRVGLVRIDTDSGTN
jgi:hypothetical protein